MKSTWMTAAAVGLMAITGWGQGLTWENRDLEVKAGVKENRVQAVFAFKNGGDKPLVITEVRTTCGCTTAQLGKKDYAPGEAGTLNATLVLDPEGGTRKKSIYVVTDEPKDNTYVLSLTGIKPLYLEVSERNLHWLVGQAAGAKEIVLKAGPERPVKITKVTIDRPNFTHTLTTVKEGQEYKLTVTPASTAAEVYGVIEIQTDLPADLINQYRAYARVLPPPPPAGP